MLRPVRKDAMTENTKDLQARLAAVPIFAGLSNRHLAKLVDGSRRTTHQAGHEIAKEGEGALALHIILDGTAEVSVHGSRKRELKAGDYFGEISLIDGRSRSASVTATSDLHTLAVPYVPFQQLLESEPGFAAGLLKLICARLREAEAD
jgi:CRP/FNR family transcriptional regulator, cyclic AMP receptor protein